VTGGVLWIYKGRAFLPHSLVFDDADTVIGITYSVPAFINVGDFNGDGVDDVCVGGPDVTYPPTGSQNGKADVFWGVPLLFPFGIVYDTVFAIYSPIAEDQPVPEDFGIKVFPNPFNSSVHISVGAIHELPVQIEIYDIEGKMVFNPPSRETRDTSLDKGGNPGQSPLSRGMSEGQGVIWSPAPNIGSGIYFVKIQSGGKNYSEKIIFIK
jgi:hypothetical protein